MRYFWYLCIIDGVLTFQFVVFKEIISVAPHKNIPPRVAVNTNNRKSVRAISVHSMYSTDRGIHRVEHSKIRNWKISLKLFVRKFPEKLILRSSYSVAPLGTFSFMLICVALLPLLWVWFTLWQWLIVDTTVKGMTEHFCYIIIVVLYFYHVAS